MKLGIFAKTFAGTDPDAVLAEVAAHGFAAAQYNMACSGLPSMPDAIPDGEVARVREAAERAGVEIVALSGTYNMIHPDPSVREAGHERLEVLAAEARAMGTRLVTLCTGTRDAQDQWRAHPDNRTQEAWADLVAAMERALAIAETHDIDLGVEPELANVVDGAEAAERLLGEMRSPRLKIVFDPANLFETASADEQRRIVSDGLDRLAPHIAMAHAKDRLADGTFVAAGQGVLDYDHFLDALKATGFDGPLVAHGLAAGEAAPVAAFLKTKLGGLG